MLRAEAGNACVSENMPKKTMAIVQARGRQPYPVVSRDVESESMTAARSIVYGRDGEIIFHSHMLTV